MDMMEAEDSIRLDMEIAQCIMAMDMEIEVKAMVNQITIHLMLDTVILEITTIAIIRNNK